MNKFELFQNIEFMNLNILWIPACAGMTQDMIAGMTQDTIFEMMYNIFKVEKNI